MMKGTGKRIGRGCRELHPLLPLHDHNLSVADTEAPLEDVETVIYEGGIEVGKFWHRYEAFEG
jgi:hypothetical protein